MDLSGRHIRRSCSLGGSGLGRRVETGEAAVATTIVAEARTVQSNHGATLLRPILRGERLKEAGSVPRIPVHRPKGVLCNGKATYGRQNNKDELRPPWR